MAVTGSNLPRTYADLEALITRRHGALSSRLKDMAEFALAHPDALAFETVAGVAERAGVPPSTLVRFAQALGFEGFSDMQRVFRERLVAQTPPYRARIRAKAPAAASKVLQGFVEDGVEALERLGRETPADGLERAVALLAGASRVAVVAQRRGFPVAAYLTYGLLHLGKPASLLDNAGGMLDLQARALRPGDLLLAVSFKPYAPETLRAVSQAHEAGVPVLAVTDSRLSPLHERAAVSLHLRDAEVAGVRSLTATMSLAACLVVATGTKLAGEAREG